MATSCCNCSSPLNSTYKSPLSSSFSCFLRLPIQSTRTRRSSSKESNFSNRPPSTSKKVSASSFRIKCGILPVDPWAPNIDSQSIASQLFAASLFPYIGFLYFITKSKTAPKLTIFGFYFLLAFVGATIPAGIYAKVHYGTSLANVDWLHGCAESLLTVTNLLVVLGLREGLRKVQDTKKEATLADSEKERQQSSI